MTPPPPLSLAYEAEPAAETVRALTYGLDQYNAKFAPAVDWTPHVIVGRDAAGAVHSGARYYFAFEWLFLNLLWVGEPLRRTGEGTRLVAAVEAEAARRQCLGVYLETYSFQAPEFYRKLGYREFGRIEDFPRGAAAIWLSKRLG